MRVRRAQARLCGRDARAPRQPTYPRKPVNGEGDPPVALGAWFRFAYLARRLLSRFRGNDGVESAGMTGQSARMTGPERGNDAATSADDRTERENDRPRARE